MEGYIFRFQDRYFSPDGEITDGRDIDAHNTGLEARELAHWQTGPDRFNAYIQEDTSKPKPTGDPYRECNFVYRLQAVTTWTGAPLGVITEASAYFNNFGARIACVRIKGTNGAEYYGRFGYDNSQLVRLRKVGA